MRASSTFDRARLLLSPYQTFGLALDRMASRAERLAIVKRARASPCERYDVIGVQIASVSSAFVSTALTSEVVALEALESFGA